MPRSFKATSEARESLLKEAQAWRDTFSAIAKSKDVTAATVAKPLVTFIDGISSSVNHTLEQVEVLQDDTGKLAKGMDKTMGMAQSALVDVDTTQKRMEHLEQDHDNTKKVSGSNEKKCNRALSYIQQMQLEHSSTVIVLRGIAKRTPKRESYTELEELFRQVMRSIKIDNIRPIYVRRLPQAGANSREPPAIKASLYTVGDKIRIYNTFDQALKNNQQLPFGVSNEIPKYALGSYKHMMRVATEVRAKHPGTKTRVGIARNASWPAITVRRKNEKEFVKIDDETFEDARNEVLRKQRRQNELKREKREERALLDQGLDDSDDNQMDTGTQPLGATARPSRLATQTKKQYKD